MALTARDLMTEEICHATPGMTLIELDRMLLEHRISGATVIEGGQIVAVVNRSDILRRLTVEQSVGEMAADIYAEYVATDESPVVAMDQHVDEIGEFVGERFETLTVRDIMNKRPLKAGLDTPAETLAKMMVDHYMNRVLITDGDPNKVVGIVTGTDFLKAVASGKLC